MKKTTLFTTLTLFFSICITAQITLVKDIVTSDGDAWVNGFKEGNNFTIFSYFAGNSSEIWATDGTEAGTINISSNINDEIFNIFDESILIGNTLYFVLETANLGAELYKTDGTLVGTSIVKDINPNFGSSPGNFVNLNNTLYFTADDGLNGNQLYKTDGTVAGTTLVSTSVLYPSNLIVLNNTIYFQGQDANFDTELWKTDGTDVGTVIVKNIEAAGSSSPKDFTIFNGELFFIAYTNTTGEELWKTDGTEAGTVLLKDIYSGINSSNVSSMQVNGNNFYFSADNGINGAELWKTDGTEVGTIMLKDITPGADSSNIDGALNFNANQTFIIINTAAFGDEIWITDGTEIGTKILKDINPGSDSGLGQFSNVKPLLKDGFVYFDANDGTHGGELWRTDGTEAGTVMIKDVNTDNSVENGKGAFGGTFNVNNKIIFEAFNTTTNRELWVTDGTEAGTTILKDINAGKQWGVSLDDAIVVNNVLLFNGNNGTNGFELWKTDGTSVGTVMLKNLNDAPSSSNPSNIAVALDKLYMKADSTSFTNARLLVSDGTTNGTKWVEDATNGTINSPAAITEFKGKVYMTSSNFGEDYGVFYTDAQDSKQLVKKINPGGFSGITSFFHYQNTNELIFAANDGTNGKELWKTDGTTAGTVLIKDLKAGANGSLPSDFFEFNNNVYFVTTDETAGFPRNYRKTLWKTDGTEAGTTLLKEFSFSSFGANPYFVIYKNALYFTAYDSSTLGYHLWRTDGTVAGTEAAYVGFSFPKNMVVIDDTMFLAASTNDDGQEMWTYDGATASLFKSFSDGANDGYFPFSQLKKLVNNQLYFQVFDNGNNSIWKTDGTLAGTEKILNNFSFVKEVMAAGDVIYFSLDDNANGVELWKSDGTEAGTQIVQDLFPGEDNFGSKNSSDPSNLTILNNDLYFSAKTSNYGIELFKLENAVLDIEKEIVSGFDVDFNLYPNPVSTKVTISSDFSIDKIEIFNLLGKRISFDTPNKNKSIINVSQLKKGVYIIKVKSNNRTNSKKLIIN